MSSRKGAKPQRSATCPFRAFRSSPVLTQAPETTKHAKFAKGNQSGTSAGSGDPAYNRWCGLHTPSGAAKRRVGRLAGAQRPKAAYLASFAGCAPKCTVGSANPSFTAPTRPLCVIGSQSRRYICAARGLRSVLSAASHRHPSAPSADRNKRPRIAPRPFRQKQIGGSAHAPAADDHRGERAQHDSERRRLGDDHELQAAGLEIRLSASADVSRRQRTGLREIRQANVISGDQRVRVVQCGRRPVKAQNVVYTEPAGESDVARDIQGGGAVAQVCVPLESQASIETVPVPLIVAPDLTVTALFACSEPVSSSSPVFTSVAP
jgi:hypothetical protein